MTPAQIHQIIYAVHVLFVLSIYALALADWSRAKAAPPTEPPPAPPEESSPNEPPPDSPPVPPGGISPPLISNLKSQISNSLSSFILHPSSILSAAALALTVLILAIQSVGLGPRAAAGFLTSGGWLMVFQSIALAPLVLAGGGWAARLGRDPLRRSPRRWPWGWLAGALAAMIALTTALVCWTAFRPASDLPARLGLDRLPLALQLPMLAAIASLAPILEESLYRHYLLWRLVWWLRRGPAPAPAAIVLTTLAWSAAHWGMMDPWWIKLAQTSILGLILGATAWRHGLKPAIALHLVFNLVGVPLAVAIKMLL